MTTASTRRRPTSWLLDRFRKPRGDRLRKKHLAYHRPRLEALEVRLAPAVDFTQGANGDAAHAPPLGDITWINGILNPNNSEYFEGVSTLQRTLFDSVTTTPGNVHTVTFSHQAAKGSAHAYDFLTSWDQAFAATNVIAPGTLVNHNTDSADADTLIEAVEPGPASPANFTSVVTALRSGPTANIRDVEIPDNMGTLLGANVQSRITAYEGFFGNRTLRIYGNAPITDASMKFDGYSGSGPLANYTLTWTSASTQILIEFAGHLAQGQDFVLTGVGYGAGKGAGSINGGPYHVQLSKLDGASLGNQDNQIQANAVSAPPDFTIDKTGDTLSKVGDAVNYTITIVNTGGLALFPQSITDSLQGSLGASSFTESGTNNDFLDVGETWTLNYSRTVQVGDPDPLVNTVTAVFDTQSDLLGVEVTRSDSHSVNLFQPSVAITKVADDHLAAVGDPIVYTITITNTSSADSPDLDLTSVTDTLLGDLTGKFPDKLAPGASATASVTRVVQAGDPDPLPNTVTVHSNPVGFPNDIHASASETVNLFQPSVVIDKTGDTLSKVGDDVHYAIVVTNTSSADSPHLVGTVSDPLLGISQAIDLAPGQSTTINATRTVQPDDPDPLVNTATVRATPVGSVNAVNASDTHSTNLFQPSISIDKTGDTLGKVGDPVGYTIKVTNTSSADTPTLVNVTLTDTLLGDLLNPDNPFVTGSNADGSLSPGEVWIITARRTVVAGDPDPLPNTATVHANPQGFSNDITASDSHLVNLFQPSLHVVKAGDTLGKVGDPVDYTFTITNNSSADSPNLINPVVSDSLLGDLLAAGNPFVTSSNADGSLSPGEVWTITATRTVLAGDPDPLPNTVTVSAIVEAVVAQGFDGGNVITPDADSVLSHSVNLFQPSVTLTKTASPTTAQHLGDVITYTFTVTNTSSADSPDLVLSTSDPNNFFTDTLLGDLEADAIAAGGGSLAPGASFSFTKTRAIQTGDPNPLPNTATVAFTVAAVPAAGFDGGNVIQAQASASVTLLPHLQITKAVTSGFPDVIHPGDTASFTITVTNDGAGPATNVLVTDQLPAADQLTWGVVSSTFDTASISTGDFLTASSATLAAGATASITVSAAIPLDLFGNPPGTANGHPLPAGLFELDGNALDDPAVTGDDWSNVLFGNGGSAVAHSFVTDAVNSTGDDIFQGGGSKDTQGIQKGPWLFTDSKPQAKDDIAHAFAATYTDPATGDVILYAGLDRFDNEGNATAGFWFFQNPVAETDPPVAQGGGFRFTGTHADGDILLVSNFTQGGSTPTITVFRWTGNDASGSLVQLATSPNSTFAIVNGAPITVPWSFLDKDGNKGPDTGEFLEMGVNLSALGLGGCFSSFLAETRSSQSPTATLSDFVIGNFDTCELELPNTATVQADGIPPITSNQVVIIVNDGHALEAASVGSGAEPPGLTAEQLQTAVAQAINEWRTAGIEPQRLNGLARLTIQIGDLPRAELGFTAGGGIWLDRTAAGWGWSTDGAPGRMDLATVIAHELGHVLGYEHGDTGVMEATLPAGTRLLPAPGPLEAALASNLRVEAPAATSGLTVRPSAVTMLDQATALAPRSQSVITVGSASTGATKVAAVLAPSLGVVAAPLTQGADIATAIAAARAEVASTAPLAFRGSVRTNSGALASSPGAAIPTYYLGVSERLASYAGPPAPTTPDLGLLFSDDGVTSFEEANNPPVEKPPAAPQGVIDRLFGAEETPLSDEAIDYLFAGDVAACVGETSESGSAAISAALALVGVGYLLRNRSVGLQDRLSCLAGLVVVLG
jgi:uncharacterized repeat protein (TIGR01451 family)